MNVLREVPYFNYLLVNPDVARSSAPEVAAAKKVRGSPGGIQAPAYGFCEVAAEWGVFSSVVALSLSLS